MGTDDLVWSLCLVSGQVGQIPRHVIEHPAFAENQIEVEPFTPSYDPSEWEPMTKDQYLVHKQAGDLHEAKPEANPLAGTDPNMLFGIPTEAV